MSQVTNYVSAGGTAPIAQQQTSSTPVSTATEGLTPRQRLILTILLLIFSPAIFAVFGEVFGLNRIGEALAAISAILTPIGVVWAIFHYRTQMRRLKQQQMQQQIQPPDQYSQQAQPVFQPPAYQPVISPPPTNPLATPMRGSVTEDETQRLPEGKK